MINNAVEVNFDGLVGPTHNYGGLSLGNIASTKNAQQKAYPKEGAIQGLKKMKLLMDLGIPQAVLPPHERPFLPFLKEIGYMGSDMAILNQAYKANLGLFRSVYSASSMWAANAATVSPSADTLDHKVHITPANLVSNPHRFLESEVNYKIFKKIFKNDHYFTIHKPAPLQSAFSDEGAANHNRFCQQYGEKGLSVFVYGRRGFKKDNYVEKLPLLFPARQTLEASKCIARLHQLEDKVLFVKQNPDAIDQGVFHNDVISVANQNVFMFHEQAFDLSDKSIETDDVIHNMKHHFTGSFHLIKVLEAEISFEESVKSFLFNSQIITLPLHFNHLNNIFNISTNEMTLGKMTKDRLSAGDMILIAPIDCLAVKNAEKVINRIIADDNPIKGVYYVNLQQSMKNGGGPACLRLRVVLTEEEKNACHNGIFLTNELYEKLLSWVVRNYPESISEKELLDPQLLQITYKTLDELTQILHLGSLYRFQQ